MLKKFDKYVEEFTKYDNYTILLKYFLVLFAFDYSGFMDYYKQNKVRRLINMARRRDSMTYSKRLDPYCEHKPDFVEKEDIELLKSIKIPDKRDIMWLSRKYTTTHQYNESMPDNEKEIIKYITDKYKDKYEQVIGKKLYNWPEQKGTFYCYHGKDAQHLWHVDPLQLKYIHNLIIVVEKKGEISPFQYKSADDITHTIVTEEGDGILFNGGTTLHQIPPNNDDNSYRKVFSIAYLSQIDNRNYVHNLCTYLEGGNNYINVFKIAFMIFAINFLAEYISETHKLSYFFLFVLLFVSLIVAKYVPYYFDIGLGSGRSSSILYNCLFLLCAIILTLSIKGGTLFLLYFILSEVFFLRSWVEYD